jgi:hypothetical protein
MAHPAGGAVCDVRDGHTYEPERFFRFGSTGRGVLIGVLCHFSIMPLVGFHAYPDFVISKPEIAAGNHSDRFLLKRTGIECYGVYREGQPGTFCCGNGHGHVGCLFLALYDEVAGRNTDRNKFINMMMEIIKIVIVRSARVSCTTT